MGHCIIKHWNCHSRLPYHACTKISCGICHRYFSRSFASIAPNALDFCLLSPAIVSICSEMMVINRRMVLLSWTTAAGMEQKPADDPTCLTMSNIIVLFFSTYANDWPLQCLWMPMVQCRKTLVGMFVVSTSVILHTRCACLAINNTLIQCIPWTKPYTCQQLNSVISTIYLSLGNLWNGWLWNKIDPILYVIPLCRL